MNIAPTLVHELAKHSIAYDVVSHSPANSSLHSANSAHIPTDKMIKPVVLEDDLGFVMALVPANQYVKIDKLNIILNRKMELAGEAELSHIFSDCERGAFPPIGDAYGMYTIVDYDIDYCEDVYIESGNHTDLLHLSRDDFRKLVKSSRHANIGMH